MQSLSRPEEPDALPELPPLDEDDEHADQPPEDLEDLGDLVADEPPQSGDVDEPAADESDLPGLDAGIVLDASDALHDGDTNELVLDIQDLLNIAEESSDPSADEPGFGAEDPDPSGDIDAGDDEGWLDEGEQDDDDSLEDLVSDELPELDDDSGPDENHDSDDADLELPGDEPRPPSGAHTWSRTAHIAPGETLSALSVREGEVVAAAVDILWLRKSGDDALRLAARGSRITSIVLGGPECDTAVFATGIGTLGRRRRASHAAEALEAWRAVAGSDASDLVTLRLTVSPTPDPAEIWLTAGERLLVSRDLGTTWERVETPAPVCAISLFPDRVFALVGEPPKVEFMSAERTSLNWVRHAVGPEAVRILKGDHPMLTANIGVVAVWDPEHGVAWSPNGDAFQRVAGSAGVSAVTPGVLDGRPTLWIAIFDEGSESTLLVLLDVETGTATTIAELRSLDEEPRDDGADEPRIGELAWENGARRLWGLTRRGLYRWEPPH